MFVSAMTIQDIKKQYQKGLRKMYSEEEINSMILIVLEYVLKKNKTQIRLLQIEHYSLTKDEKSKVAAILEELKTSKPLQYVIGEVAFYGLSLKVNENVLIPRPETEELADWILEEIKNRKSKTKKISRETAVFNDQQTVKILDIGTGTGCISIALAKNIINTEVHALDISSKALDVAKENAKINNVNVYFHEINILENQLEKLSNFDVIVSNPPYITFSEKELMKRNVLNYEPHLALFVEEALVFYKRIAELAQKKLKAGGMLFFEINQYYGDEIKSLLKKLGYNSIELKKDLFGNDRMICAVYGNE